MRTQHVFGYTLNLLRKKKEIDTVYDGPFIVKDISLSTRHST